MGTFTIPDPRTPGALIILDDTWRIPGPNAYGGYEWMGWIPPPAAAAPSGGAPLSAATGVNPTETSYSLYGHTIPVSVFGVGRIGGEIIAGPWIENGLASFIISFGVPADPTGTRDIREIAFDSEVVWSTSGTTGVTTSAGGTFSTEAFTFRFYQGTLVQAADTLESTHFGADAVAYRPQILLAFSNLPLAGTKFGKIPYVSAVIGDGTGDDVNLGEAFERLAASPWVDYADFETTGITDGLVGGGLIITQQADLLQLIQQFGRFYRNWDILQTDKLRIVDRGSTVTADIVFDRSNLMGPVVLARAEPNSVPRKLKLSTIDPDADFTIVPSEAAFPKDPVNVSTSVKTESAYLPAIMDSSTRMAIVTFAKYQEEVARKKINLTAMIYGLEIEPGDLIGVDDLGDDFPGGETFKVVETLHGANYSVEISAESILNCTAASLGSCGLSGSPIGVMDGLTPTGAWSPSRQLFTAYAGSLYTPVSSGVDVLFDQSGNARNFTAPGPNNRPGITCSTVWGLDYDGVDDQMRTTAIASDFITNANGYIIISWRATAFLSHSTPGWNNPTLIQDNGQNIGLTVDSTGPVVWATHDPNEISKSVAANTTYVSEWRLDGGRLYQRLNGAGEVSLASLSTPGLGAFLILGSRTFQFQGQIFEVAIFNTVPSLATRDALVQSFGTYVGAAV